MNSKKQSSAPLDLQLAALHKRLLANKLDELTRLLGLDALQSSWVVTNQEFEDRLELCNRALDKVSGVSRTVRTLVWLSDSLERMATEMTGRPWVRGEKLAIPMPSFIRFAQELVGECPTRNSGTRERPSSTLDPQVLKRHPELANLDEGTLVKARFINAYVAASAAANRSGQPHRGDREIPDKWTAFRDLAAHLGLVSTTMSEDSLKRTVLRGRQKLAALTRGMGRREVVTPSERNQLPSCGHDNA